jgi:hypothetical protein
MRRCMYIVRHPFAAYRFVKACRAPWPTIEAMS